MRLIFGCDAYLYSRNAVLIVLLLQAYTTQTFRRACGVTGKEWPDPGVVRINPTTGVKYLSPFFEYDVTESRNHDFCLSVAKLTDVQMKVSLLCS